MAAELIPGFGGRLRRARERRGVTLRQVADRTKIPLGTLEALERNDISRLPNGIFGRGFVRSYALEVGLDPEATIQEFVAQFPEVIGSGPLVSDQIEDNEALESNRQMAVAFLRLVAVSVPVVGIILYLGMTGRQADPEPLLPPSVVTGTAGVTGASVDPVTPAAFDSPRAEPAAATGTPGIPIPRSDRLRVRLEATGPCWVAVIIDNQEVPGRLLQAGDREELDVRHELVLTAGDAAALSVTLNGIPTRPLGGPGQVVTARMNLSNFSSYLAQ
jgi:transcriptional regulator with XRE-family HTH domain